MSEPLMLGFVRGRPDTDLTSSEHEGMRVAKEGSLRGAVHVHLRRQVILLLGGDRSGEWNDWYDRAISLADDLYEEYLEELKDEGLI